MSGHLTVTSGLVSVTHAGAPIGPEDESTYDMVQSVLADIELAIQPFAERMREFGGRDIPPGLKEVKLQVQGVPPDLADEVLARCNAQISGA
jgi:hypothetical protein